MSLLVKRISFRFATIEIDMNRFKETTNPDYAPAYELAIKELQETKARLLSAITSKEANPVRDFMRDECEICENGVENCSDVFQRWTEWCSERGIFLDYTSSKLSKEMRFVEPSIKRAEQYVKEGSHRRRYKGFSLKAKDPF